MFRSIRIRLLKKVETMQTTMEVYIKTSTKMSDKYQQE